MATISVLDATGATQTVEKPNANGRAAASASRPVALSTEDKASIDAITAAFGTTEFYPETQPVSGTVAVSGSVAVTGTFWQATQPVSVASLPLPTGAATETTLAAIQTALGGTLTVDGSGVTQPVSGTVGISGSVAVTGTFWQATQPVSAASLPLPSGAATSANQSTANGLLTSIDSALGGTLAVSAAALPLPSGAATSAKQDSMVAAIEGLAGSEYETVAASQTDQALGATGGAGDLLVSLLVIPATTSPGAISIKDGAGSAITVFTGGSDSVSTLHPFTIPLGIRSGSGAWSVTTGANVSVIAAGNFA